MEEAESSSGNTSNTSELPLIGTGWVGGHGRFLRTESWKLSELCIWTLNQAYHARGLPLSLVAVSFFKSSSYGHDDSHDFLNLSSVLFHLSLGWLMEKLHLFSLRALVWLSHHIKLCFCAFFLCQCFHTLISRFAFLFLPLSPPSFSREVSGFLSESPGQGVGDQFKFCWAQCHTLAILHLIITQPRTLKVTSVIS